MTKHHRKRQIIAGLLLSATLIACSSPEQRLAKYLEEGQKYFDEQDYTKSRLQFRNAYELDENNTTALAGLVAIAEQDKDYRRMFGLLQSLVRLDPENIDAIVDMGNIYLLASDEAEAQTKADRALELNPQHPGALALHASILYKLGDAQTAIQIARKAIIQDPANQNALSIIVTELGKNGNFEGAIAELDAGLAKNPGNPLLSLLRIEMLNKLGLKAEVDESFEKLISLYPDDPSYYETYTHHLIRENRFADARANLIKINELTPENLESHLRIIRLDYQKQGAEKAKSTYISQIEKFPENSELRFSYAGFLERENDVPGAIEIYQNFAKQKKDETNRNRGKVQLAGIYIAGDRREEGEKLLEEVLESDPGNTNALTKRAGIKIKDELYDEAILDLRNALSSDPNNADSLVLFSLAFEKKGDIDFAELQLTRAFEADPVSARVSNAYAKFLINNDKPQRADEILQQNLKNNPSNLEGYKLLATARLSNQNWSGANEVARLLEEKVGADDPALQRILGTASLGLRNYDEAINQLSEANKKSPLKSQALATLISAYIAEGRAGEAEVLLNRMLKNDPQNYDAYILQAQVAFSQKKIADGEAALNNAILADPDKSRAYDLLYRYYLKTDRRPEAFALIYEGLDKFPENFGLKVFEADILLQEGRFEDALTVYESLHKRRPDDQFVANNFASLLTEIKTDPDSATLALEVAKIVRDVESPAYQDTLGWAYYRAGDYQNARLILRNAVEEAPNIAVLQYHLGAVYVALGDFDRGRQALEKALQIGGGENFRFAPEIAELLKQAS